MISPVCLPHGTVCSLLNMCTCSQVSAEDAHRFQTCVSPARSTVLWQAEKEAESSDYVCERGEVEGQGKPFLSEALNNDGPPCKKRVFDLRVSLGVYGIFL